MTIVDADGDTATQHLTVEIGDTQSLGFASEGFAATSSSSDSSFSNLSFSNDNSKLGGFGNGGNGNGNTGIVSSMVAASGLAVMSSSLQGFNDASGSHLAQNDFQSLSAQIVGREGLDSGSLANVSVSQLGGSPVQAVNLSSSGIHFGDQAFGGHALDVMSIARGEPTIAQTHAGSEPVAFNASVFAANVPTVSMASAAMLKAVNLDGNVQHGGAVEQVLADALGSHAPTIDGVLANLPGGIGGLPAIANLASPDTAGVPGWDMGMHGGFAPMHDMILKVAAVAVHQDAVQPA